jgi:endonuclease/exonuclease/phosphatase (EEP) superfamily protein YafD
MRSARPLPDGTQPSNRRGFLREGATGILLILAAGVGVMTAFGFVGGLWWVFDLLSHPRLQYAGVAGLIAIGLAVLGRRGVAVAAVVLALVNAAVVAPFFLFGQEPAGADGSELTVVSFNVQIRNPDREAVVEWVRNLDADVVFLWETSQPWRDEFISAELPFQMADPLQEGMTIGGLVLTREAAGVRLLETGDRSSIEVTVPFGDDEVTIIGVHPFPPSSATHTASRDFQLSVVAELAARIDGPLIVTGDLNTTPWSAAFQPLSNELVNSMNGFGWQPTYPAGAGLLMLPIDHLLHSNDLTTVDRSTGPDLGSDHLPLIVTVARSTELTAAADG